MNRFKQTYAECLKEASEKYPDEYWWTQPMTIHGNLGDTLIPKSDAETVAASMFVAMDKRSYNKDGRAFRMACKKLGIPHTYKAINLILEEAENATD